MTTYLTPATHVSAGDILSHTDSTAGFTVASVHEHPGGRLEPHRHLHTCVMVVTSGAITVEEPSGVYLLSAGTICIRLPGTTHAHVAGPQGSRYVLVELSPAGLARLGAARVAFDQPRTFRGRSSVDLAVRLAAELHMADDFMSLALCTFVQGIALGCARYTQHGNVREPPLATAARRFIERNHSSALDVGALAKSLGCTPAHLSRIFRLTYGLSPLTYSLRRRLERGRRLLATSSRSIADIALSLGFHDSSHFAKHFRRLNGVGAREFRQVGAIVDSPGAGPKGGRSISYR